ncbi:MAG: hypothetical protein R3C53_04345 [Pirellulaceae bacterium]
MILVAGQTLVAANTLIDRRLGRNRRADQPLLAGPVRAVRSRRPGQLIGTIAARREVEDDNGRHKGEPSEVDLDSDGAISTVAIGKSTVFHLCESVLPGIG